MPTLKAAIDASQAQAGAEVFNKAAKAMAEGAVRLDMALGVLQDRLDRFSKNLVNAGASLGGFIQAFQGLSVLKDATKAINELNVALMGMTKTRAAALQATRDLAAAQRAAVTPVQQLSVATKEAEKRTDALATLMKQAKYAILGYFSAFTAISIVKNATAMMGQFDESMRLIGVVTGATKEQLAGLTEEARYLGATTRFNAQQVSEGMYELSKAGFTAQETLEAIGSTLNLAQASLISLADASAITSNTLRQFEMSTKDATRVADVLMLTANRSNASVLGLGETMKYAGAIAHGFGASLEQVSAMAGVLANRGMEASMAGTNIRGIMLQLATVTDAGKAALKEMGLTFRDVAPDAHDFLDILRKLRDGHLDATKAGILFDTRNAGAALILSKNVEEIAAFEKELQGAAGTSQAAADAMDDSLRGSLLKLKAAFLEGLLVIGDSGYGGGLQALVTTLSDAIRLLAGVRGAQENATTSARIMAATIRSLTEATAVYVTIRLAQWLASVSGTARGTAAALVTFRTGMAAATASTLSLTGASYAAGVATRSLGVAFKGLWASIGPVGWVVLGLTAAIELYNAFGSETRQLKDETRSLTQEFDQLATSIDALAKAKASLAIARDVEDSNKQISSLRSQAGSLEEMQTAIQAGGQNIHASRVRKAFDVMGKGKLYHQVVDRELIADMMAFNRPTINEDLQKRLTDGSLTAAEAVRFLREAIKDLNGEIDQISKAREAEAAILKFQAAVKETINETNQETDLLRSMAAVFMQTSGTVDEATRQMNNAREIALAVRKAEAEAQDNAVILSEAERASIIEAVKAMQNQRDTLEDLVRARKADEEAAAAWVKQQEEAAEKAIEARDRQYEQEAREIERMLELRERQADQAEGLIQSIVDENELLQLQVDMRGESNDLIALELDYLRAVQQVRELDLENQDEVLRRIREQIELQHDLKKYMPKSDRDAPFSAMMKDLENEEKLVGLVSDARERAIEMTKAQAAAMKEFGQDQEKVNQAMAEYEARLTRVQAKREMIQFAHEMSEAFTDSIADIIYQVDTLEGAFRSLYMELSKMALQKMALTPISNFLTGALSSFGGAFAGTTGGATIASADGNIFSHGHRVQAFANGGIIDRPTTFGLAGGDLGLAGEKGPEVAIAPLSRTKNGRLGVDVTGVAGGGNTSIININVTARDADSFRRSMPQIRAEMQAAMRSRNER